MAALRKANPRPQDTKIETATPWRDRPHLTMKVAAEIAGLSTASLYRYAGEGELSLKRLAGRTFVDTASLAKWLQSAEPWQPSASGAAARAARAPRAAQART